MEPLLTKRQAFDAMFCFLDGFFSRTNSDDVGALLGDLLYDFVNEAGDPETHDPAAWDDWLKCVNEVMADPQPGLGEGL